MRRKDVTVVTTWSGGRDLARVNHGSPLDADEAVTQLYAAHYSSLVRLASLLLRESGPAEDLVQDTFVAMHGRWDRLRDPDKALAYLRRSVVNRAHSLLRHRIVAAKHAPSSLPHGPAADVDVLAREQGDEILRALAKLPLRQREVLVLRHYLDLSEAEIAAALGISRGAVKSHSSRGLAHLRTTLERQS